MIENLGQRPLVMGIVNVTPDSFSGDGVMRQGDCAEAVAGLAARMIGDGADILDIGGESSRPDAAKISAEEEIRRVMPAIAAIRKESGAILIAVDTVKAEVAKAALTAGASIINDTSALADPAMMQVAASSGAYIVLMHNRANAQAVTRDALIGGQFDAPAYQGDIVEEVARELGERIAAARAGGIAADKIIADPGLGFGKTVEQNLALINRLDELKGRLGVPVLIGPSRKSFIGRVLDAPAEDRLAGTAACVAMGVLRGADIVRVHDVKEMARVAKMVAAIARVDR